MEPSLRCTWLVGGLLCWGMGVQAQEAIAPLTGARLRVTAPGASERALVGALVSVDARELVLSPEPQGAPMRVPRSAITRLELHDGKKGHAVKGMLIGALAGLAVMGIGWAADPPETSDSSDALYFVFAAGLGALPGAGIGALVRTDLWKEIPPANLRVTLSPLRGRGVSIRLAVGR